MSLRKSASTGVLVLVMSLGLVGCGAPETTPTPIAPTDTPAPPTPTATLTPIPPSPTNTLTPLPTATPTNVVFGPTEPQVSADVLDMLTKAGIAARGLTSYHFTIESAASRTTGAVEVKGEGDYVAPDKRRLTMQLGGSTNDIIIIGQDLYFRGAGARQYVALGGASNPLGGLGAASTGQDPFSIVRSITSAEVVGDEQLDGVNTTHIKYTYDVDRAASTAYETSGTPVTITTPGVLGTASGEMWIEKGTNYVRKIVIMPTTTPGATGTASATTITLSRFNEPVTPPIDKPENASGPDGAPLPSTAGTPGP